MCAITVKLIINAEAVGTHTKQTHIHTKPKLKAFNAQSNVLI